MTKVWFIRHAESEANAGLPTLDSSKVVLTAQGHKQAKTIALSFPDPPSLIVTSSYTRTKQTASPTQQRFRDVPYTEWPVHEFTYLSSSHQFSTKQERRPLVKIFWERNDPYYIDGNGAESFYDFLMRVNTVFEYLNRFDENDFIAVFSHGQFIRAVLWTLKYHSLPTNMKLFQHFLSTFPLQNGDILEIPFWEQNRQYVVKRLPSRPSLLKSAHNFLDATGHLVLA